MSNTLVRDLIDSGIHFGHQASRWNPKMAPYIFGKRSLIHIIDVKETLKGLLRAKKFVAQVVAGGKDVLFVGTKRQARKVIENAALETGMHYVTDRWLGGTLTNFMTIRSRLARLEELERLEEQGLSDQYSKKQAAANRREMRKIKRNLEGIRRMTKLPGVLVLVDQRREIIAVKEARKLGVPTICLLDTDGDPDMVDLPIPGNDDAMRAIEIVVKEISAAIAEAKAGRADKAEPEPQAPAAPAPAAGYRRPRPAVAAGQAAPAASDVAVAPQAPPAPSPAAPPPSPAGAP